ncbi:hypothetical protein BpHYR1_002442 [Brachionus plicatilis]|uniref:Uncharacterized protein n=1 Tax=Brachionus plicatilis TaxID=10195 RepID=A0A3M7QWN1_BRAPC|nr:hypothetical protein BpHYR1_002442 [Brachionus plicatilis]
MPRDLILILFFKQIFVNNFFMSNYIFLLKNIVLSSVKNLFCNCTRNFCRAQNRFYTFKLSRINSNLIDSINANSDTRKKSLEPKLYGITQITVNYKVNCFSKKYRIKIHSIIFVFNFDEIKPIFQNASKFMRFIFGLTFKILVYSKFCVSLLKKYSINKEPFGTDHSYLIQGHMSSYEVPILKLKEIWFKEGII